ncbi:hypothetical protein [Geodermatophilus sp. SYSU D01176]
MTVRLWTALLLLAAVFTVHGAQCTAAAEGAGSASHPAVGATGLGPIHSQLPATAPTILADPTDTVHATGAGHAGPPDTAVTAAPASAGHGGAPHDAAGHLWTACLAVLAAGLAVLLAVLAPRLAHLTSPALTHARARFRSRTPRPPGLSALCLLRI